MSLQKTPLLTEVTVDLIKEQIINNFNLMLQELDNTYNDGINLEPVQDQSIFISDKYETLNLPSAYILFSNHAFQYTDNQNYLESNDECVVVITCEDIDGEQLTRKCFRYGRVLFAAFNLMDLKDVGGRVLIKTIPQRLGYTDTVVSKLKKEQQRFRKDIVLELKLLHFENNLID